MSTYRVGDDGVTIVRQGTKPTAAERDDCAFCCTGGTTCPLHPTEPDEFVAVVVNGDRELAKRICALLNASDAVASACTEETRSWDHFTPEQTDSYWIRCTLSGPHDEHEDEHTGLTWRTEAQP